MGTNASNGHVELRPDPICMEQIGEMECGHGVYIMSKKEIYVGEGAKTLFNGKKWSQVKAESMYVPAKESYAPLTSYITNECKQMNCSKQVEAFKVRAGEFKNIGALLKN